MKPVFSLKQLILPMLPIWLMVWGLGIITLISVVGLLMVSGWFITMAGLSGLILAGSHTFNYLAPSAMIRTFAIVRTAGRYGELVVSHGAIFELLKQLRVRFFGEFAKLDTHTRAKLGSSVAQYRLIKDIDVLDEFALKVISPQVTVIVMAMVIGLIIAKVFSWVVLVGFMVVVGLSWLIIMLAKPIAKLENTQKQARAIMLTNTLPSLTQLVLWGRWQDKSQEFLQIDKTLTKIYKKAHRQRRFGVLLVQWTIALTALAVLYVGASLVGHVGVAVYLAVLLAVFGFFDIGANLVHDPLAYGRSLDAKDNLNQLLSTPALPKTPLTQGAITWHINELSAKQTGAVFGVTDVNCTIKTGTPLVIQGVSGGGKSTLLDTLAGEIEPVSGQTTIEIAGESLPSQMMDWQGELGYLGQRIDIFNQSLRDNLKLGKSLASDDELWQALGWVGLDDWAKKEPLGLDTPLGEYGVGVSGGQGRRIALARLLLSPKRVLLLDEPFAGLDKQTRHELWQTLKDRQKDGILVVVSHHDDIIDGEVARLVIGEPSPV